MSELQGSSNPPPPPPSGPWYFKKSAVVLGFILGIWPGLLLVALRPPRTRKKTAWCVGIAVALGLLGALPDSSSPEKADSKASSESGSTTTSAVKRWNYKDHILPGVTIADVWSKSCSKAKSEIRAKNSKYVSLLKTGNKYVGDPWGSSGLIDKVSWWGGSDSIANSAFATVAKVIRTGYAKSIDVSGTSASQNVPQDYLEDFLSHCKLKSQYSTLDTNSTDLDSLRIRVRTSASNVPWYPKGYSEYSTGLAWKWERASCQYGDHCWSMSVISLTGCSSLYVEITILDRANNNIGYNNDLAQGVRSGQRTLLRFEDFTPGASSAQLSEINCY